MPDRPAQVVPQYRRVGVWIPGDGPERLAGHVAELDAAVHAVRGTACSPDGSVYREVDIYGAITRLQLTDFAMERGPQRGTALEAIDNNQAVVIQSSPDGGQIAFSNSVAPGQNAILPGAGIPMPKGK
ncbi:hypothetical protein IU444_08230 [Nocardia farcinica]|nr:hypothetical protein [Nocardia farcinica]MBF6139914.1 hypothetical protein [Nocardia farcinica]MBF6384117.1 hypothetical protein [Nocardia farcinica]